MASHRLPNSAEYGGHHALTELEHDVSNQPIRDNNVSAALREITAFYVPEVVEVGLVEEAMRFAQHIGSLTGFFAIRKKANCRTIAIELHGVVRRSHNRKLNEVRGAARLLGLDEDQLWRLLGKFGGDEVDYSEFEKAIKTC